MSLIRKLRELAPRLNDADRTTVLEAADALTLDAHVLMVGVLIRKAEASSDPELSELARRVRLERHLSA